VAGRFVFGGAASPDQVDLRVVDQYTGGSLGGVAVTGGELALVSNADGAVRFDEPEETLRVTATLAGYAPFSADIVPGDVADITLQMVPTTLRGILTDASSGAPVANADVAATGADGTEVTTKSGADGSYALSDIPDRSTLRIHAGDYGVREEAVGDRTEASFAFTVTTLTGRVADAAGDPLAGAMITSGEVMGVTDSEGAYRITGVADGAEVTIAAPGYLDVVAALPAERALDVTLEPIMIKAVYANAYTLSDADEVQRLVDLIDRTELNAIVIDIKQDAIFYDTQVPFFTGIEGMVTPTYDVNQILALFQERDIYTIARMVVFQDPLVAEARPDLAVLDDNTGGLWRNSQGVGWVNAFEEELWDANIELALEAAGHGFDEIQYDYVRFPSDGDLTIADFGREYTQETRSGAITEFMRRSYEAIKPTGAKFAADLFGFVGLKPDDQGIGQLLTDLAPQLDYICLMIYPSHFIEGNIFSAPGDPNDYPYETILESLERAIEQLPEESRLKMRPWLQDFYEYGPEEVGAQIQAAEDFGSSGWLLWDPSNVYTVDALDPA